MQEAVAASTLSGAARRFPLAGPAERLKLVFKFKALTLALYARKRLYALFAGADDKLMVNVGGGLFFRPGWRVMDHVSPFYPFARRFIDFDADLCSGAPFPFADGSVDFFYSAHTLEHIPQEHCPRILAEIHRCLKRGGAARLNMPDYDRMRQAVAQGERDYFAGQIAKGLSLEEAVVEQIATECVGRIAVADILRDYHALAAEDFAERYCRAASRAVQKERGGYHINWFTERKLGAMLREAGFREVYRSAPQQSRFPELRGRGGILATGDVFEVSRMLGLDTTHPEKSLYMEAVK